MIIDITKNLNEFLEERKDKFPNVSIKQKQKWVKEIEDYLKNVLNDNDIFYDNMPDDVEEK